MADSDLLLILDVYALVYRAFFALPPLTTSSGLPVNAAYGFQRMLHKVLNDEKPTHVVACFDAGIPPERFAAVPEYKANRKETPDELGPQFPVVRRILQAYGIPIVELAGEEADDCIATIVTLATKDALDSVIISGDLDLLQLVNDHCTAVVTRRGISEMARYDVAAVRERFGLAPEQLPDFRGLKGDPSDNLPGVPGIGEKTAAKLIQQFGTLDALLANVDAVTPKRIADLLREHADKARACRDVSQAKRDLAIVPDWQRWRYATPSAETLAELYRELEFKSLLSKVSTPAFSAAVGVGSGNGVAGVVETQSFTAGSYRVLEDADAIVAAITEARRVARVAIALLPVPRSWRQDEVQAIALAWQAERAVVFRADAITQPGPARDAFAALLSWMEAGKVVYDAKNVAGWMNRHGFRFSGIALDLLLSAALLDPSKGEPDFSHALDGTPSQGASLPGPLPPQAASLFEAAPPPRIEPAWAAPADALLRAGPARREAIANAQMQRVLDEIEQPLAPVLADMEAAGFRLDVNELLRIGAELETVIAQTTADIYRLAGEEFNLNSPKALGTVLFEKLGLPAAARKKGGYGTGAEVLAPLAAEHEIAAKLLAYREVSKLKSTYVDALPGLVDPRTGLVHTTLHQLGAATGRLSSTDPNLQNIPIRSDVGRAIRRAFLPPTPNNVLLAADYSQIELRLFAHLSGDSDFIAAFNRGDDIHDYTARAVFAVPAGQAATREMRRRAKAVNFGILYGMSDAGLAQREGMTRSEAKQFIADYLARFPSVNAYIARAIEQARQDGFVTTLFGRRRYLPDLRSRVYPLRAAAERMAINAPMQGSAADIIKLAMVRIAQRLRERQLPVKMLLQVHDELIFDVPPALLETVRAEAREAMERVVSLSVPLVVEFKAGPNWAEAEALH